MTQLLDWAVPWSPDELVNLVFLSIACALACAVPVVYAVYANLRDPLREVGITVEAMATPAAARTYNVLVGEERRVAAALIAVA